MAAVDQPMADRSHLSIGEVLSLVQEDFPDVTISKIRFLESQGLLDPERTPSGYRKFYEGDIERLQWILVQQRDNFLPLKVIRERLDEWDATGTVPTEVGERGSDGGEPLTTSEGSTARTDARHAAATLAAASAVEILDSPSGPTSAPVMAASTPVEVPAVESPADGDFRVGPTATSLTAEELAVKVGLSTSVVVELESYSMIESKRVGSESYFETDAVHVAQACRQFLDHGIEVRHLRMYKIAAEREAGVFEQLVMPLLKQRNPAARARAVDTVRALAEAGEALHAALLRSALSDTLP